MMAAQRRLWYAFVHGKGQRTTNCRLNREVGTMYARLLLFSKRVCVAYNFMYLTSSFWAFWVASLAA